MSEILNERETPQGNTPQAVPEPSTVPVNDNPIAAAAPDEPAVPENDGSATTDEPSTQPPKKKKWTKKKLITLSAVFVVVVVAAILLIPSKFKRVESKCCDIAGIVQPGDGYFMLDTYPEFYFSGLNQVSIDLLHPQVQENALEAIQYANKALGFSGAVYERMLKTTALMGRQSEENSKYKVSWTYHPSSGLEVTYEKKK